MKAFYLTPMIAHPRLGNEPLISQQLSAIYIANPSRPYACKWLLAPAIESTGAKNFAFAHVGAANHTELVLENRNLKFPDLTLDAPLGTNWTAPVRNKLGSFGFSITGINTNTSLADALQILNDQIALGWNRLDFDVEDFA